MQIVKAVAQEKYRDKSRYEQVGEVVYRDLAGKNYVVTLYCLLEEGEDFQYPLEDLLDRYFVHCTGYLEELDQGPFGALAVELEGSLSEEENLGNITAVAGLIGRRVYNREENGCVALAID